MSLDKRLEHCGMTKHENDLLFKTVEMHTGGGPVRIVLSGFPEIVGDTLLDKRQYLLEHLDQARRMVLLEPRGHNSMYAVFLVKPDMPEADLAVIFSYGEYCGYMCGYATIALGRFAIDYGLVKGVSPETTVKIQCPCGLVTTKVEYDNNGKTGATRFESIPCFVFATNLKVDVEEYGQVQYDIVFGGNFYAYADISQFGINFDTASIKEIIQASMALTRAAALSVKPCHPDLTSASYIGASVLYDSTRMECVDAVLKFILVYGDCHVERSGCGTGCCGFLALLHRKELIKVNEWKRFVNGKTRSQFTARVVKQVAVKDTPAVITELSGKSFYTGECTFLHETSDPLHFLEIK